MQMKPKILKQGGKPVFVVLPYAEYRRMQEAMEDLRDSLLLAEAREENRGKPTYSHGQIKEMIAGRRRRDARQRGIAGANGRRSRG